MDLHFLCQTNSDCAALSRISRMGTKIGEKIEVNGPSDFVVVLLDNPVDRPAFFLASRFCGRCTADVRRNEFRPSPGWPESSQLFCQTSQIFALKRERAKSSQDLWAERIIDIFETWWKQDAALVRTENTKVYTIFLNRVLCRNRTWRNSLYSYVLSPNLILPHSVSQSITKIKTFATDSGYPTNSTVQGA